jgi:hypothetical protein
LVNASKGRLLLTKVALRILEMQSQFSFAKWHEAQYMNGHQLCEDLLLV